MRHRGYPHPRRGRARPPSVPVVTPVDEVLEVERELDARHLQIENGSAAYARRQREYA